EPGAIDQKHFTGPYICDMILILRLSNLFQTGVVSNGVFCLNGYTRNPAKFPRVSVLTDPAGEEFLVSEGYLHLFLDKMEELNLRETYSNAAHLTAGLQKPIMYAIPSIA